MREAARWVVIDKPPGVLSVPGKGPGHQASVASWARQAYPRATGPLIVHRLDMETSGLMVLALDAEVHQDLSRQFERRLVEKHYEAVVRGVVERDEGVVTLPMRLDVANRPRQVVDPVQGREAETRWRVLARGVSTTLMRLEPRTGRTHQLRVHMASIGHAIVGDSLYGGPGARHDGGSRLRLHAAGLGFGEPGMSTPVWCERESGFGVE